LFGVGKAGHRGNAIIGPDRFGRVHDNLLHSPRGCGNCCPEIKFVMGEPGTGPAHHLMKCRPATSAALWKALFFVRKDFVDSKRQNFECNVLVV
jgi:hypothetical protein